MLFPITLPFNGTAFFVEWFSLPFVEQSTLQLSVGHLRECYHGLL